MVKKSDFTSIGVRSFPTRGEEYEFVFEIVNLLLKIKFKGRGGGGGGERGKSETEGLILLFL